MSYLTDAQIDNQIEFQVLNGARTALRKLQYFSRKDFDTVCKEHVGVTVLGGRNEKYEVSVKRIDPVVKYLEDYDDAW